MLRTLRKAEYAELMILFFIQAAAMAIWFVPLGTILDAHGLQGIKPFAFAATALAAFISPLMFGAMADRHVPPAKVLRWLATATAVTMAVIATALKDGWTPWLVLALIQIFSLSYAPMFSISTALVLARLADAKKEFGPVRALATLGWMAGALLIGLLNLDRSAFADYLGAVFWLLVAAFTYFLPALQIPPSAEHLSWHERLGLDALKLLKDRDTRVVFITTTLFNIPLCAFYPYAPTHLHDRGFAHTSAWMSLAQITRDRRHVQPGVAAAELAVEMDFRLRPRLRRAAVCVERAEHQRFAAAGHHAARRVVRAGVHHRADLSEPAD